jgi:hypothetical protein
MTDPNDDLQHFRKLAEMWIASTREAHVLAIESMERSDTMLAWGVATMGAAIWSANTLLESAPACIRLLAIVPWVLGIVAALVGRVCGQELREKSNFNHFKQLRDIEVLIFVDRVDVLRPLMQKLATEHDVMPASVTRWRRPALASYWLAHIMFGTGVIAVVLADYWLRATGGR